MNASSAKRSDPAERRYPSPQWLTKAGVPIASWMHQPQHAIRKVGVVLSSSIGIEALFAYPAVIQWADALAESGVPCVRIDPPGAGDSDGTYQYDGLVARWKSAFAEAAGLLRAQGVTDVVLAGVRLGALVAAAAAEQADSKHIMAWSPFDKGRSMVREMAAFDQMFRHSVGPDDAASAAPEGAVDGAGARFGAGLVRDLEALRIQEIALPAASHVLIIPRDDVQAGSQFADVCKQKGAEVSVRAAEGYAGAHAVPEHRTVPTAVFEASVAWLREKFPAAATPVAATATPLLEGPVAQVRGFREEDVASEREVRFGPGGRLVGVLAEPIDGKVRGPGVVLVNAGLIHHVGPHRQWLEMARRWAALGIPSLRIDIGGVAGSAPPDGEAINRPYPAWAVDDVGSAMVRLRAVSGVAPDVVLVGLCAGAHHSFHAAQRLSGIRQIVMIDPINYYMLDSDPLSSAEWEAEWKTHAEYDWYTSRLSDPDAWKKLFSGQVNMRFVARTLARKGIAVASAWVTTMLPLSIATRITGKRGDLGGDLLRIVDKGTSVRMIFAGNAPGLWYLRMYARRALAKLHATGRFTLEIGEGADHTFSKYGWRRWLNDTITDTLVRLD